MLIYNRGDCDSNLMLGLHKSVVRSSSGSQREFWLFHGVRVCARIKTHVVVKLTRMCLQIVAFVYDEI